MLSSCSATGSEFLSPSPHTKARRTKAVYMQALHRYARTPPSVCQHKVGPATKPTQDSSLPTSPGLGREFLVGTRSLEGTWPKPLLQSPLLQQDTALTASHERFTKLRKMMQLSQAGEIRLIFLLAQISTSIGAALQALDYAHYQESKTCSCKTLQNQLHTWISARPLQQVECSESFPRC